VDDLKFDTKAMVNPKTDADVLALLAEVVAELRSVNAHFKTLADKCAGMTPP